MSSKRCGPSRARAAPSAAACGGCEHHHDDPDKVGPLYIRNRIRGLLCNGCNGAVGYFDRHELGHQFEWVEAEAVEARMRIGGFRIGRPLYPRAVQ